MFVRERNLLIQFNNFLGKQAAHTCDWVWGLSLLAQKKRVNVDAVDTVKGVLVRARSKPRPC